MRIPKYESVQQACAAAFYWSTRHAKTRLGARRIDSNLSIRFSNRLHRRLRAVVRPGRGPGCACGNHHTQRCFGMVTTTRRGRPRVRLSACGRIADLLSTTPTASDTGPHRAPLKHHPRRCFGMMTAIHRGHTSVPGCRTWTSHLVPRAAFINDPYVDARLRIDHAPANGPSWCS